MKSLEEQKLELIKAVLDVRRAFNAMYSVPLELTVLEVMRMSTMQLATMYNSIQRELP